MLACFEFLYIGIYELKLLRIVNTKISLITSQLATSLYSVFFVFKEFSILVKNFNL